MPRPGHLRDVSTASIPAAQSRAPTDCPDTEMAGLRTASNDPREHLIGMLATNQEFTSPEPPRVVRDSLTSAVQVIDD